MKRILFVIFSVFLCFSVVGQTLENAPKITIQKSKISVGEALSEITRQTKIDFSYNSKSIDTKEEISFQVTRRTLSETMNLLCKKIEATHEFTEGLVILFSAKKYTISGFITDQKTGETLIGASVALAGTSKGIFTNEFGFYSLELSEGEHELAVSYVGYDLQSETIELNENIRKEVALKPSSFDLPRVEVGLTLNDFLDKKNPSQPEVKPSALSAMPEFAGESGLIKGLQSFPGIKTQGDGSAFYNVRGGERDQNLVIIDDAPIFNPSHMFGFYSLVVPDLAKSIKIYKSDIPAIFGDKLSSVIDIRTKDGNQNKFTFGGSLNPLVNQFSIETPILWKSGSFLASVRRSNFQWLYQSTAPNLNIFFGDLILKTNLKLGKKNRVFFTNIWSGDRFINTANGVRNGVEWANVAGTLRWNHVFGSKLFLNTTFNVANYDYRMFFGSTFWLSTLENSGLKAEFTHYFNPSFTAKYGFHLQGFSNEPGSVTDTTRTAILPNISENTAQKNVMFFQSDWNISEKLKIKTGLRYLRWINRGPDEYFTFDENYEVMDTVKITKDSSFQNFRRLNPRLSIHYKPSPTNQISVSAGRYHQFLQMMSNSNSPFSAFDIWLPSSVTIAPQSAWQFDLSYLKYMENRGLEISTTAYFKKMHNQIDYAPHANLLINPLIEGELRFGKATAYGLEFFLKKEVGKLTGRFSYDFSKVKRTFPDLNEGNTYVASHNRTHEISLLAAYPLKRRISLSGYWTLGSGNPFSSPTGFFSFNDTQVPIFGEKNNDRLPHYRRLDLSIKFILNKRETSKYQHSLIFSIYNVLARKNTFAVKFNKTDPNDNRPVVKANLWSQESLVASQIDLIRFMPSLTYKFKI